MGDDRGSPVSVDRLYRMMDAFDESVIEKLQTKIAQSVVTTMQDRIDRFFFDVTSLHFESEVSDDLRENGNSKNGKFHRVQAVLALAQTTDGLPVGYRVFKGHTTDMTTLTPVIEDLKARYAMDRAVVVADSGVLRLDHRRMLQNQNLHDILAARWRSLPAKDMALVTPWKKDNCQWAKKRKIVDLEIRGERLVVCFCPKRHQKDRHLRNESVKKARNRCHQSAKGANKAARFLSIDGQSVQLNPKAIQRDPLFDGWHGVFTSLGKEDLSAQEVVQQYGQ
ncbi:MAG: IS1634 family transposase [Flavobacteriaceae bacterium]|nr:IS1634 family transposase [Flavobacteriaceae bacterium]